MKEKTLLKLAITSSLTGILFLAIISSMLKIPDKSYSEFEVDDFVSFDGKVKKVTSRGNVTIISIEKIELVDVVVFENLKLSEGISVKVEGTVDEYKGDKQVLGEKIVW